MLEIIKQYFGFNTKEAKNYIKQASNETLQAIKKTFEDNAKRVFIED